MAAASAQVFGDMESRELALSMTKYGFEPDRSPEAEESARTLRRAIAGDTAAFERIVIRHQRQVLMTALRLLGRVEDAQDAAQEVFFRLHKHLRRFDQTRDLVPWLYRVTVNVCHDLHRKRARNATLGLEEAEEVAILSDPEGTLGLAEQRRMVAQGLKTLPEKERAALVLRDIEGLSTREVARVLRSSETTVRSQVSTARVKIKKFIEGLAARRS